MSARNSPLGSGLYFIDVFACQLFCLALALVGARFGAERSVEIEVPAGSERSGSGAELTGWRVRVEGQGAGTRVFLEGAEVSLEDLESRLRDTPPPSIVLSSDASALARLIATAHAAGVHDVELAYDVKEK
jgi:hypothetical protein